MNPYETAEKPVEAPIVTALKEAMESMRDEAPTLVARVGQRMTVEYDIDYTIVQVVRRLSDHGERILAIKLLRTLLPGIGLAETKVMQELLSGMAAPSAGTLTGHIVCERVEGSGAVRVAVNGAASYWKERIGNY